MLNIIFHGLGHPWHLLTHEDGHVRAAVLSERLPLYMEDWEAAIGEELQWERERQNTYTMAVVYKNDQKILRICEVISSWSRKEKFVARRSEDVAALRSLEAPLFMKQSVENNHAIFVCC